MLAARRSDSRHEEPSVGALVLAFIFFIPFAFSEELFNAIFDALGSRADALPLIGWWLPAADALLISAMLVIAARLQHQYSTRLSRVKFWEWSLLAAILTLALDVITAQWDDTAHFYREIAIDAVYIILTAILLAVVLGVDPSVLRRRARSDTEREAQARFQIVLPLIVGTFAAYIGGEIWDYTLSGSFDQQHVGGEFFAQLSQVIPLLLVALALETNFFKSRMGSMHRAIAIVTVIILSIGEVAVVSALVPVDNPKGWHEFAAFILGIEAVLVGLTALVAAVIAMSSDPSRDYELTAPNELDPQQPTDVSPSPSHPVATRGSRWAAVGAGMAIGLAGSSLLRHLATRRHAAGDSGSSRSRRNGV